MNEAYEEYLRSEYWKSLREEILEKDHHRCVVCGRKENLNVHHLTYDHLGDREAEWFDLVTLCRDCHQRAHELYDNFEIRHDLEQRLYDANKAQQEAVADIWVDALLQLTYGEKPQNTTRALQIVKARIHPSKTHTSDRDTAGVYAIRKVKQYTQKD